MITGTSLLTRVAPPSLRRVRRARYLLERNLMVYRHMWTIIFSGFFEPLFYLLSIGVGIQKLVGDVVGPDGRPIPYTAFVAPALLASSAMNGAVFESTMNIFFKLKYGKIYDAILATPVGTADIAAGEITWALIRGLIYAVAFLVVMLAMGLIHSVWGVMALPAALLIGFGFAGVGLAATTYMKSWQDFELITLVTLPLFLFSATFFPLSVYPEPIRVLAQLSPLYHGVELIRAATLGSFHWSLVAHAAFLAAMGSLGLAITSRRLGKLLLA